MKKSGIKLFYIIISGVLTPVHGWDSTSGTRFSEENIYRIIYRRNIPSDFILPIYFSTVDSAFIPSEKEINKS